MRKDIIRNVEGRGQIVEVKIERSNESGDDDDIFPAKSGCQ